MRYYMRYYKHRRYYRHRRFTGTGDLQAQAILQAIYRHRQSTGTGDTTGDITITKLKAMGEYSVLEAWVKIQAT